LPQRIARGQSEAVPLNKMRQAIATALQRSKQQVPHFYVTVDVDGRGNHTPCGPG